MDLTSQTHTIDLLRNSIHIRKRLFSASFLQNLLTMCSHMFSKFCKKLAQKKLFFSYKASYARCLIRKATNDDIDEIIAMFREQFQLHHAMNPVYYVEDTPKLAQVIREYVIKAINDNSPHLLVAEAQDGLAGFITFTIGTSSYLDSNITRYGEVIEVYVRSSHRQSGLGKRLMKEAENHFQEQKCMFARLATCSFNAASADFYDSLGYTNTIHIRMKRLGDAN